MRRLKGAIDIVGAVKYQCPSSIPVVAAPRRAADDNSDGTAKAPVVDQTITNTEAIGRLLYTQYVYFFQAAGLILLVAMIGAIVLTLRHKEGVRRQSIAAQNARTPAAAIDVVTLTPGQVIVPSGERR